MRKFIVAFVLTLLAIAPFALAGDGVWRPTERNGTLNIEQLVCKSVAGGATITDKNVTEILDVSASEVTTGLIPADAFDVIVCVRNTSTIVGTTAVSYQIGIDSGDVDAFGTGIAFTDAVSTDMSDWTVLAPLAYSSSAREVRVTPDAGTLDTGTIRVVAYYHILAAQSED